MTEKDDTTGTSIWFQPYTLQDLIAHRDKYLTHNMGIEMIELGPTFLVARMPVDERTWQPFRLLHGGASCVLSESLGSIASHLTVDPAKFRAVGVEINANHVRSATKGCVIGTARPLHRGKRLQVWTTDIVHETSGHLICTSRLTTMIVSLAEKEVTSL